MKKNEISVVSPVYKTERIVDEFVRRLTTCLSAITAHYEIILVDDGSPDNSWERIVENCARDSRVRGLKLSRNFGQQRAIAAGLNYASAEWVVVMDCDLQDKPEEIQRLYEEAKRGYDIVFARKMRRRDSLFRLVSSDINHRLFGWLSGIKTDRSLSNFGIYRANVIDEMNKLKDIARAFPVLFQYLGFRQHAIDVEHAERHEGKSSYTFGKLLYQSIDAIVANSNKPLYMSIGLGLGISLISFILALYNVTAYFAGIIRVPGFTTTVFSIFFSTGMIMLNLGIVGLYVGKVFDLVKSHPLFIVQQEVNFQPQERGDDGYGNSRLN